MYYNPHTLCIQIDGSAFGNPGHRGGISAIAEFPDSLNMEPETIFQIGFGRTTSNRMELTACIRAFEWAKDKVRDLRIESVTVVTDSTYVYHNQSYAGYWKKAGWKNKEGRPVENPDLWKRFLSTRYKVGVRTEVRWEKGKKSAIAIEVDKKAKKAAGSPAKETDAGYRFPRISRTKIKGGVAAMFPARGQEIVIRIYGSHPKMAAGQKISKIMFEEFCLDTKTCINKYYAYAPPDVEVQLHRAHYYKVRFNENQKFPKIEECLEEIKSTDRA